MCKLCVWLRCDLQKLHLQHTVHRCWHWINYWIHLMHYIFRLWIHLFQYRANVKTGCTFPTSQTHLWQKKKENVNVKKMLPWVTLKQTTLLFSIFSTPTLFESTSNQCPIFLFPVWLRGVVQFFIQTIAWNFHQILVRLHI